MDSRKQLLQTLMQDLQAFSLPERYSDEKKAEIMRGRKGQAQIDAGRAEIRANEEQYQKALDKRKDLQDRVGKLQGDIDQADTKAAQDNPVNQAIQYGKSVGVPAAGYAAGHIAGKRFGKSFDVPAAERASGVSRLAEQLRRVDKTAPASKAQAAAIVDTFDKTNRGRGLAQFLGPAALAASSVATQAGADYVSDPHLKEGLNIAANAERYGAAGMGVQQVFDTLRGNAEAKRAIDPTDVATIESARRQVNAGGKFDRLQGALREAGDAPSAPAAPPAAAPAAKPGTRTDLYRQAKAEGLAVTTRTKKAELQDMLAKKLRENAKRARSAAPKAIVPLAAGAGVYDAMRTPAQAGEGEAAPMASRATAAAAGGAAAAGTAGLMAGGQRLMRALADVPGVGTGLRAAGRVAGPVAGALTAYDAGSAVLGGLAQGEDVAGADRALRQGNPQFFAQQEAIRQGANGEAPAAPVEADLAPIAEAAAQDPELAEMLRELIMARAAEAGGEPIPNAMASAAVAQRGDGMAEQLRNLAMR